MVRVITIKDNVYERLRKLKDKKGMSFSEVIEWLLDVAKSKESKQLIYELEGILEMNVLKRRMRVAEKW